MTEHEQYRLAFSALQTQTTPDQILQRAEQAKGVITVKRKLIPILAAAILLLLMGTVAAAEMQTHWLSKLLGNVESHPEISENIENPGVSNTVDGTTYSIDRLLAEGRTVYWQLTKTRRDGAPVEPIEAGESPILILKDGAGLDLPIGFSVAVRRLDDGSNPSTCTLLYQATVTAPELSGEALAGMTLSLTQTRNGRPSAADAAAGAVPVIPVLSLETVIRPYPLREATVAENIGLNIGRLCIEVQGLGLWGGDFETAAQNLSCDCALVLKDGRELPVYFSIEVNYSLPENAQWHIADLPEIIDPQDAVALRVGDALYPISDR